MLNEKTKNLKLAFFNHMKNNYNVKESELELRYKIYLEKNFKGQKI